MATLKCIEAKPGTVRAMQVSMSDMDAHVQEADDRIAAMTEAMKLMLLTGQNMEHQSHLVTLCEMIKDASWSAMNEVNAAAETYGANWVREEIARV